MAKTKARKLSMPEMPDYVPSIYIDLEDPDEITGLEIGKEVKVEITGKIKRITLEKGKACLVLSPFEAEVVSKSAIEELLEDD